MPPMPPEGSPPIAGAFSGLSATTASVVRKSAAIDAAFCSAERTTLVGSGMPAASMSPYSPVAALRPWPTGRPATFSATTPPEPRVDRDLADRGSQRDLDDVGTRGL